MKTSSADVPLPEAKGYFFLPWMFRATRLASRTVIELPFDAGLKMNRPVAALRPATMPLGFPDFGGAWFVRVVIRRMCVGAPKTAIDK